MLQENPGFKAIIDALSGPGEQSSKPQPVLGHTFVGYRRKGFDEFVAVFKFPANSHEQTQSKFACGQIVENAEPGSEAHEAANQALQHWPPS